MKSILAMAAVAGLILIAGAPRDVTAGSTALLLAQPLPAAPCNYHCRECSKGHDIVEAEENEHHADHLENCNPGSCDSHSCGGIAANDVWDDWSWVWPAIDAASPTDLVEFRDRNVELVAFNAERESLQVLGCEGQVVANIPLTGERLRAFEIAD